MRALLALLLVALSASPAFARTEGPVGACFDDYDAGRYEAAAGCFLLHAADGGDRFDAQLLYDAGNAYYRDGKIGEAVWAYRLAQLDRPRDGDLRANLASARAKAVDDLTDPFARGPVATALLAPYDALSGREMLLVGTFAWALLFTALAVRTRRPFAWTAFGAVPVLALIAALGLGGYLARTAQVERRPLAVVTADEVTLRSGRDVNSVDLAKLHAGAELAVVSRDAPWVQVRLEGDVRGWVPDTAVALVRPTSLQ